MGYINPQRIRNHKKVHEFLQSCVRQPNIIKPDRWDIDKITIEYWMDDKTIIQLWVDSAEKYIYVEEVYTCVTVYVHGFCENQYGLDLLNHSDRICFINLMSKYDECI